MTTYADQVAITGNATADTESTQTSVAVNPGARIFKISVISLTVGNTYAIRIDFPGINTPQKYLFPSNGAVLANGGKLQPSIDVDCDIPVPSGITSVNISTFADVASATAKVGIRWTA